MITLSEVVMVYGLFQFAVGIFVGASVILFSVLLGVLIGDYLCRRRKKSQEIN